MALLKTVSIWLCLLAAVPSHADKLSDGCEANFGPTSETGDTIEQFTAVTEKIKRQRKNLQTLIDELPNAFPKIDVAGRPWFELIKRMLASGANEPSDMVTMALVGAARAGKSTLTNAFARLASGDKTYDPKDVVTPQGRRGGTTVRPLIVVPRGSGALYDARFREVSARYPTLERMKNPEQLLEDGPPLWTDIDALAQYPNLFPIDLPDMTTGDHRLDTEGRNLAAARDGMLAADVFFVMLSDDNQRDLRLSQLFVENFKLFGLRKSVFIIRTDAEGDDEYNETRDWLVGAARRFYDFDGPAGQLPDGVLGIYAMPYDPRVKSREKHPELVALGESPIFPVLMEKIAKESAEIRVYAAEQAAKTTFTEVNKELEKVYKQRYAINIYKFALEKVAQMAPAPVDFPYEEAASTWRDLLSSHRKALGRTVDKVAGMMAAPGQWVHARYKQRRRREVHSVENLPFSTVLRRTNDQLKVSWETQLSSILVGLGQGRVDLPADLAEELVAQVHEFNRLFPENAIRVEGQVNASNGLKTVWLPSRELLSPTAQAGLSALTAMKTDKLMELFTERISPTERAAVTEAMISEGLRAIYDGTFKAKTPEKRGVAFDAGASGTGGGGSAGAAAILIAKWGAIGASLGAVGLATGGLTAAAVLRSITDGEVDAKLKPQLAAWYTEFQSQRFSATLKDQVFEKFDKALDADLPVAQARSLDEVRKALRGLNAPVADYADLEPAGASVVENQAR